MRFQRPNGRSSASTAERRDFRLPSAITVCSLMPRFGQVRQCVSSSFSLALPDSSSRRSSGHPCIAATISWWIPPPILTTSSRVLVCARGMDPFRKHVIDYANVQDLMGDRLAVYQHRHYRSGNRGRCHTTPCSRIGHWTSDGNLILAIVLRMVLIFHVTFCINSFAHMFGSAHYHYHLSGRDHRLAALLTNGEVP